MAMKRLIAVIAATLILAGIAAACGPRFCYPAKKVVYAAPVVVAAPVVLVPTYSVSYQPLTVIVQPAVAQPATVAPAAPAQPPAAVAPPTTAPEPKAEAPAADQTKVFATAIGTSCVQCHGATTADAKGNSFVLVDKDNKVVPLSLNEKRSLLRRIASDDPAKQMPPPNNTEGAALLTPAQRKAFSEVLKD